MTTDKSRHVMVECICEWCGKEFLARRSRLKVGLGKFCSRQCSVFYGASLRDKVESGYEHAQKTFDKSKNVWSVWWLDESRKMHSTTYARWRWEQLYGTIPDGYKAGYADGNPLNIDDSNIIIQSPEDFGKKISSRMIGHSFSSETLEKMSKAKRGSKSKFWKGGTNQKDRYVLDAIHIRPSILERDSYSCQSCGKYLNGVRDAHMHHIDTNRRNNDPSNLIILCRRCHNAVHSKSSFINSIVEKLRSRLPE